MKPLVTIVAVLLGVNSAAPAQDKDKMTAEGLSFTAPKSWKRVPPPMFALAALDISADQQKGQGRISLAGGSVIANVARWRNQLNLPQLQDAEIAKLLKPIKVDGIEGHYVDLANPKVAEPTRLLGVIVPKDGQAYFFTLRGPIDLLEKEKPAFEAFIKSVRFAKEKG